MPKPADRLNKLPPYVFAVTGQRIQEMRSKGLDVISLDIGSPDLPPPPAVVEALAYSARQPGSHGYSGYKGIPAFREAIARHYLNRFGVVIDPEREVLPLLGSKEGIVNLSLAYLDRGDLALVPEVGYPSYSLGAHLAGARVQHVPTNASTDFLLDLESIPDSAADRAKLLWVNYPNNPTGATAELPFYERIVEFCQKHDVLLASDNPYVDVTFDGYRAGSVLQIPAARSCAVEFMSFSKTYNMGGWRLGAAVGNADALKLLLQIKSNVDSGHFRSIYDAGIVALDTTPREWIDARNHVYERRRDRIMETLPLIGLRAHKPKGSLYVWGQVEHSDGGEYTDQALRHALVALTPGAAYGQGGSKYVRISLGVPDDRLEVALKRLQEWYAGVKV